MNLTIEDLQSAKDALEEEDRRMIERCVYNLCGRKSVSTDNWKTYSSLRANVPSANIKHFGEASALELLAKLGQYFLKTDYGS